MPQFEQASEIFRTSWGLYSKVVEHDYMTHQRLNSAVRAVVVAHFGQHRLRLIELGCEDAAQTAQIFRDLPVDDYQPSQWPGFTPPRDSTTPPLPDLLSHWRAQGGIPAMSACGPGIEPSTRYR